MSAAFIARRFAFNSIRIWLVFGGIPGLLKLSEACAYGGSLQGTIC